MESHRIARIANSPSINETIANLTEFSLHMGTIAFSEDYDFHGPEEISKGWIIGEPDEWPQEDPCSAVGLGRILNQSYNREEALKKKVIVLGKDVRLQEETYSELSRRLLRAGKTAKAIEAGSGGAGLRMPSRLVNLARILYRVQNPTRESTNAVACRVTTGLPGTHKDVAVRLPMTASLETINGMLRAFVLGEIICASKTVPETQLDDILGSWQYQLLAKSGKGSNLVMRDSRRVKLMKDADYRSMIKIVVEPGPVKMVPLLTPVGDEKRKLVDKRIEKRSPPGDSDGTERTARENQSPSPDSESSRAFKGWLAAEGFGPVDWTEAANRMERGEDITQCDLSWMDEL